MICFPGEMQRGETGNPATVVPKLPKGRCFLLRINVSRRGLRAEENRFGEKFAAPRLGLESSMRATFSRWKMGTEGGHKRKRAIGAALALPWAVCISNRKISTTPNSLPRGLQLLLYACANTAPP